MSSAQDRLREARDLVATDPERAKQQLLELASTDPGLVWSEANVDLAALEFGYGNIEAAEAHASAVLKSTPEKVTRRARAIAGVLLCEAVNARGGSCDLELLRDSINACSSAGEHTYAGAGYRMLSYIEATHGNRPEARRLIERAVEEYRQARYLTGAAAAVLRLAQLMRDDGEADAARSAVDAMLKELEAEPLRGTSARLLEQKLRQLL